MSSEEDTAVGLNRAVVVWLLQWEGNCVQLSGVKLSLKQEKGFLTHLFKTAILQWCMEPGAMRIGKTQPEGLCYGYGIRCWFQEVRGHTEVK